MAQKRETWFVKLLKINPFPRAVNKLFSMVARHIDSFVLKLSGGKLTLVEILTQVSTVQVTMIGRKSGLPRTSTLFPIYDPQQPERFAIIASNFGQKKYPAWSFNIRANPDVQVNIGGNEQPYRARELALDSEEYNYFWDLAVKTYFGYAEYKEAISNRTIPIFVLERTGDYQ